MRNPRCEVTAWRTLSAMHWWTPMAAASVQDRDDAPEVLKASQACFPFIQRVFADGIYAGQRVTTDTSIVVDQAGFQVLPRLWLVLRMDQSKPPACKGLRGNDRFRHRTPRCRLRRAADQATVSFRIRIESDSQNHTALSTSFINPFPAANRRQFSAMMSYRRSFRYGPCPAVCGVIRTFGIVHRGCSAGSGSIS